MLFGPFKDAIFDVSEDNDLTNEVDLGNIYTHVLVLIPASMTSSTFSIQGAENSGGTFYPVHDWNDADADGTVLKATTAGTGLIAVIFPCGFQYIKVAAGSGQAADHTLRVRGINR